MTVHGAKGLEAPVIFLTECGGLPSDGREPNFATAEAADGPFFLWAARKDDEAEPLAAERERRKAKRLEEYRRLLYVGLTRARERLYVVGHLPSNGNARMVDEEPDKKKDVTEWPWHALVAAGLNEKPVVQHLRQG